jgi:multiple sugar transport system substrate-binding protein
MSISRTFLAAALALALLVPARVAPAGDVAVIDFWTTETAPERLAAINYVKDVFEILNDDVRIIVKPINENDLFDRIVSARVLGEHPALINAGSELITALGSRGYLDAGASAEIVGRIGRSRFFGGSREMLEASMGKWHGVPFHGWVQGVWYRKDWFEEAGLDPPADWKSILAAARSLHDPESGRYGIVIGTKADHYAEQVFTQIARSNGAAVLDGQGGVAFDSERMVEALDFYVRLAKYTPPGPQNWRGRDFYLQGRLAMIFYSTFIMDDLALPERAANSLTGDNFPELEGAEFDPLLVSNTGMVPVIENRRPSSYGVVNALAFGEGISKAARGAAIRFADFLFERESYITWLHMAPGGMLPVIRGVGHDEDFLRDPGGVFRSYGHDKMAAIISGLERVENFSSGKGEHGAKAALIFAEKIIPEMIREAVFEGVPPGEAVSRASARMLNLVGR